MLRARARATLFKIFLKGKESHFSFVFHAFCGWRGLDGNFFFAFFLESASAFSSLSRSNLCNVHRFENHGDGRFWERGRTRRRPNRNVAELPAVCQEISGNSTDSDQTACHLVSTIPVLSSFHRSDSELSSFYDCQPAGVFRRFFVGCGFSQSAHLK